MSKEICDCGNEAIYCYLPGHSNGDNPFSCDSCVPRGCSCNYHYLDYENPEGELGVDWVWIDEGKIYSYVDNEGRFYPCVEHDYDPDGYEK
jgi:hypothetical protein